MSSPGSEQARSCWARLRRPAPRNRVPTTRAGGFAGSVPGRPSESLVPTNPAEETMLKLIILAALGAGYVLGARAGRERYDQIASKTQQVWRDPRIQRKAFRAQDVAAGKAAQAGSLVGQKSAHAATSVQR